MRALGSVLLGVGLRLPLPFHGCQAPAGAFLLFHVLITWPRRKDVASPLRLLHERLLPDDASSPRDKQSLGAAAIWVPTETIHKMLSNIGLTSVFRRRASSWCPFVG